MTFGTGSNTRTGSGGSTSVRASRRKASDSASPGASARKAGAAALLELGFGEARKVMLDQCREQRVIGIAGLHHHLATLRAAAGAAGDLRDHGVEALGRAIVGRKKRIVGVQHRDEGKGRG